ncbi:hypothetical protein [Halobacterium sp. KA-6]|uniref:hypothetical protein n=1 Tax=Halobacterium sp. KA-6 TaxID=2896368 RepID=UPI001E560CD6|nr:hypothetical protein [Halobacterium sp. KA-6]MCD2204303.1 hypothetical protein [Halobacterium sp. KA-6]
MRFRDDNRAVTVQIGAVLLFATLIIALSLYQATVVPSQNADIEYKHSQTVQNQMTDVRNGLLRSAATGNSQPVSVALGTQYPSRVFLMNPPPATGTLRTGSYENSTIRVSNINATNEETRHFLNGSWMASTKYLEYEPNYHEYDNAPNLLYETSILSNFYPNTNNGTAIPLTEQLLVDNETRTITLVTLNGSLSTTRASSVTVSPETLSAPYQRVQVQPNETGEPVNVSVPTRLSANQLEDRTDLGSHPGVIDVVDVADEDRVVVQVEWTDQFTLQTARVGVGSGTENPPAHYLTLVENRGDRVTVEARDRFNNAESGVKVSVNGSNPFYETTAITGTNGRATFEVNAFSEQNTTLQILNGSELYERVNVTVQKAGQGPVERGDPPTVTIDSISTSQDSKENDRTHDVDVTFTASDRNNDITNYSVRLYDSSSKSYLAGEVTSSSYTGGQTTVTVSDTEQGEEKGDDPYYVVVIVGDDQGNTASAEQEGSAV